MNNEMMILIYCFKAKSKSLINQSQKGNNNGWPGDQYYQPSLRERGFIYPHKANNATHTINSRPAQGLLGIPFFSIYFL